MLYLICAVLIFYAWRSIDLTNTVKAFEEVSDPYQVEEQEAIHQEIEQLKNSHTYTQDHMLLIHDPYGTNTLSMYVYFQSEEPLSLSYTIHVDEEDINDFTKVISSSYTTKHEFQIIGLVPDCKNEITFTLMKEDGSATSVTTSYLMGSLKGQESLTLEKTIAAGEQISDELYAFFGNEAYVYLYDQDGVLRGELPITADGSQELVLIDGELYFNSDQHHIAAMNALGQITKYYELGNYELAQGYTADDQGNLLLLASDHRKTSVADQLLQLNVNTGEITLLADFTQLLSFYYLTCCDMTSDLLDWLHLNDIQFIGKGEILVSSRETSTILKLSIKDQETVVSYMMGEASLWKTSGYSDLLLQKNKNFSNHAGQSSILYTEDEELTEGQYYLTILNNNFGYSKSQSSYDWSQIDGVAVKTNDENAVSNYYRYLVDEKEGTYDLVETFELPFSPYDGSLQLTSGYKIIWNTSQSRLQVYDEEQTVRLEYQIDSKQSITHIAAYSFDGFYFNK